MAGNVFQGGASVQGDSNGDLILKARTIQCDGNLNTNFIYPTLSEAVFPTGSIGQNLRYTFPSGQVTIPNNVGTAINYNLPIQYIGLYNVLFLVKLNINSPVAQYLKIVPSSTTSANAQFLDSTGQEYALNSYFVNDITVQYNTYLLVRKQISTQIRLTITYDSSDSSDAIVNTNSCALVIIRIA